MENEVYKTYIQERNSLISSELEQTKQYDKYILTLASGAFGLSLLFITNIAPIPKDETIGFLVTAWAAFGASILSTMLSFLSSFAAFTKQRQILNLWYKKNTPLMDKELKNQWATCTKTLNIVSVGLFMAGVVFLTIFAALNLSS